MHQRQIIFLARNFSLTLIFTLTFLSVVSQSKYEREQRIKFSELPESCQSVIHSFSISSKIKCFKETRIEGYSYEVKTKLKKQKISIELDANCNIEDVELSVKFSTLDNSIRDKITNYLNENYSKHSILKTQLQLVCSADEIKEFIATDSYPPICLNGFELVVKAKDNQDEFLYELFFDKDGILQRKEQIVTKNTSNLEF